MDRPENRRAGCARSRCVTWVGLRACPSHTDTARLGRLRWTLASLNFGTGVLVHHALCSILIGPYSQSTNPRPRLGSGLSAIVRRSASRNDRSTSWFPKWPTPIVTWTRSFSSPRPVITAVCPFGTSAQPRTIAEEPVSTSIRRRPQCSRRSVRGMSAARRSAFAGKTTSLSYSITARGRIVPIVAAATTVQRQSGRQEQNSSLPWEKSFHKNIIYSYLYHMTSGMEEVLIKYDQINWDLIIDLE